MKNKIFIVILTGFVMGLLVVVFIFNWQQYHRSNRVEISFLDSRTALVFWTTDHKSIGYIKYGTKKSNLNQSEPQTSSLETEIHTVVLEKIPTEGIYVQFRSNKDHPLLLWHKTQHIVYDYQDTQNNAYHP